MFAAASLNVGGCVVFPGLKKGHLFPPQIRDWAADTCPPGKSPNPAPSPRWRRTSLSLPNRAGHPPTGSEALPPPAIVSSLLLRRRTLKAAPFLGSVPRFKDLRRLLSRVPAET
ncbi:unnamed protein product [Urochloa humidicola]